MQQVGSSDKGGTRDWLGQAMAAHQAGRRAEAQRLYRRAIQANPRDARALRLRGILARELGDLEASGRYLGRAAEVAAASPEPLAELAVTRMAAGDLEGAERALREALNRDPAHVKSLANLGALRQYRGHIVEAIGLHERVLARQPGDHEVRCNLAKALAEAGRGEEALALCDEALAADGANPLVLAAKGAVLWDLGRCAESVQALERAVVRYADDDMAWVNLAYARVRRGEPGPATEALRAAVRANPASARATADLINLLAGAGRREESLGLARDFLAAHPGERQVLAAQVFALRDAGCEAEAAALLDFDRLIRVIDVRAPNGFTATGEFNARLRQVIETDPSLLPSPASKATRGGAQTGEFSFASDPVLVALRRVIDAAIAETAAALGATGLAGHPAMARAAPSWTLRAWGTVLEGGGSQSPHIHPLGWLSGVYYAALPADMGAGGAQAGWLEFGAPPERFVVAVPAVTRAVEPVAGRLVIFPSYFYHRTLPFAAAGRRISIAFDVVPR